jgi:hypothetical protein
MRASDCGSKDVVVGLICLAMIVMTVGAVGQSAREIEFRLECQNNLRTLGKAMALYANDYQDELAKAGGKENEWVPTLPNWLAQSRQKAYDMTSGGVGKVTVTSSLYLLIKYAEVKPRYFVCPSEPETHVFTLEGIPEKLPDGFPLVEAWDFGGRYNTRNNPTSHCSYSYHAPFGGYVLTTASEPGMAVLTDRNPWMDPNRVKDPNVGWARFEPGTSEMKACIGNSDTHQRDGQNVLFLDTHVKFETRATCGVDQDNIYTLASDTTGSEKAKGLAPKVYDRIRPAEKRDSVLVQELGFDLR